MSAGPRAGLSPGPMERLGEALFDGGFAVATRLWLGAPTAEDARRASLEARELRDFFEERGFLDDPRAYHADPGPAEPHALEPAAVWSAEGRVRHRRLAFESGFAPHPGEPGRGRWLARASNRTAHALLLEHPEPRPWLVCLHGFGMGTPRVDFAGFRVGHLFRTLRLNLAFPALPLHGPRGAGRFSGSEVLDLDYRHMVHLYAQAAWDVRRLIGWLRRRDGGEGRTSIGLYGISLGGGVAALVASLEEDLDAVIAGIPAVDFPILARDNAPRVIRRQAERDRGHWQRVREINHPVSPLTFAPLVPRKGRFIYAGLRDRVVSAEHPRALWHHWDEPELHWFAGGHVLGVRHPSIAPALTDALVRAGMVEAEGRSGGRRAAAPATRR